ncbi:MAG: hypothetical protein IKS28_08415 [Clostridia bacterium]|nr:hypothetical protein [Clostridia bacterium]
MKLSRSDMPVVIQLLDQFQCGKAQMTLTKWSTSLYRWFLPVASFSRKCHSRLTADTFAFG